MAWRKIEDGKLTEIANAIRKKDGSTGKMRVGDMPSKIEALGSALVEMNNPYVTNINEYLFQGFTALKSIVCPTVAGIGNYAFLNCTELTTAIFPNATAVGDRAFCYCRKLVTINFSKLKRIPPSAFDSCDVLERAELPSVTWIGSYAFAYTPKLKALIFSGSTVVTLASTDAFTISAIARGTGYIYVPDNLVNSYKKATNWSAYANQIKPLSLLENQTFTFTVDDETYTARVGMTWGDFIQGHSEFTAIDLYGNNEFYVHKNGLQVYEVGGGRMMTSMKISPTGKYESRF